jgi:hypothetical protein
MQQVIFLSAKVEVLTSKAAEMIYNTSKCVYDWFSLVGQATAPG